MSRKGEDWKIAFPGIDPYQESPHYWRDFHQSFITYWRDWLLEHLPDHYDVIIDERVARIAVGEDTPPMVPDLTVSQKQQPSPPLSTGETATLQREVDCSKVVSTRLCRERISGLRARYMHGVCRRRCQKSEYRGKHPTRT
ncbi:MAG: DUF4058 family protein [Planctomycetia bacterium]|nr:DUF4058 family protein [Planctomycetia bacterium]